MRTASRGRVLPRLDRVRVPVLQRVGLEAAVVHPAAVSRARRCSSAGSSSAMSQRTLFRLIVAARRSARGSLLALTCAACYDALVGRLADARTPALDLREARPVHRGAASPPRRLGYALSRAALSRGTGEARRTWGVIGAVARDDRRRCSSSSPPTTRSAPPARRPTSSTALENGPAPPFDRSAPVFQVGMYDQTLPFYLQRTTTLGRVSRRARARPRRRAAERHRARGRLDRARGSALPQGYALLGAGHARQARGARRAVARPRARPAARADRAP